MLPALFESDGSVFVPTEMTRGGWSDHAQHGSPPAGILARALEAVPTPVPMQVVRFNVDLFREVPLRPLTVETRLIREGRRIQLVEGALSHNGQEVGRAVALKIRTAVLGETGELRGIGGGDHPPSPGPDGLSRLDWRDYFGKGGDRLRFHTDGVDIRTVDDSFIRAGPGESWFRLLTPLVAGEELSPFQRVATMADLANGNSQALDPKRWLYVNPDTTLYLHRLPEGEWVGMRSVVHQGSHGIGVTETRVYDRSGRVGHISQSQVLERR
jgi:hypothetical protein